jgi:hypothetical protein
MVRNDIFYMHWQRQLSISTLCVSPVHIDSIIDLGDIVHVPLIIVVDVPFIIISLLIIDILLAHLLVLHVIGLFVSPSRPPLPSHALHAASLY